MVHKSVKVLPPLHPRLREHELHAPTIRKHHPHVFFTPSESQHYSLLSAFSSQAQKNRGAKPCLAHFEIPFFSSISLPAIAFSGANVANPTQNGRKLFESQVPPSNTSLV